MLPGRDCPDERELRDIASHPLTQKLNRELLEAFERPPRSVTEPNNAPSS